VRESLRSQDFGIAVVDQDGGTAFRIEPLTGDDEDE
jgi:hypothetical protein